jgi:uncharacterized protein with FMN-binding domain
MKKRNLCSAVLALTMAMNLSAIPAFAADATSYKNGTYTGTAMVSPDADEDFDAYSIKVQVSIASGKISSVAFTDDNTYGTQKKNQRYSADAMNGVSAGILAKQGTDGVDVVTGATCTSTAIKTAVNSALEQAVEEPVTVDTYVLMNIPYADFYKAELNNSVEVDAITSATLNKTRTSTLVGGSYHVSSDGTDISGITFPVKVSSLDDLKKLDQITDSSSVTISVTNRGTTSETTYTGKEALFEAADYSYYVLSDTPSCYKELTVGSDGSLSFGKIVGETTKVSATATITTDTSYGDYQVDVEGLPTINTVYGVVLSTDEADYGLRHLENVWRTTELAWCTGFTTSVHNSPTSSDHYAAMMGQTIKKITYITDTGIYAFDTSLYVPVKFSGSISAEDAKTTDSATSITEAGLPTDYAPVYQLDGKDAAVSGGKLTLNSLVPGQHTLTVSDKNGKYASLETSFIVSTTDQPASYDNKTTALVAADGFTQEQFKDYLSGITSVQVGDKSYAATGKGAVKLVLESGAIDLTADPFAESGSYSVTVTSTGYPDLTFELVIAPTDCDGGTSCPSDSYTDLDSSKWYHTCVDYVIKNGLMVGDNNKFSPNGTLTRAMLAQILYNRAGTPAVTGENPFTDVDSGKWYSDAVRWAYAQNLVEGYGDGRFGPEDYVTREQLATILWRAAGSPEPTQTTLRFTDAGKIDSYAQKAMLWVNENHIVEGYDNGTVQPLAYATRAEAATMLMSYLER